MKKSLKIVISILMVILISIGIAFWYIYSSWDNCDWEDCTMTGNLPPKDIYMLLLSENDDPGTLEFVKYGGTWKYIPANNKFRFEVGSRAELDYLITIDGRVVEPESHQLTISDRDVDYKEGLHSFQIVIDPDGMNVWTNKYYAILEEVIGDKLNSNTYKWNLDVGDEIDEPYSMLSIDVDQNGYYIDGKKTDAVDVEMESIVTVELINIGEGAIETKLCRKWSEDFELDFDYQFKAIGTCHLESWEPPYIPSETIITELDLNATHFNEGNASTY